MGPRFKGLTIAIMAFVVGTGVAYGLPHSTALSSAKLKQPRPSSSKAHGSDESPGSEGAEASDSPDPEATSDDGKSEVGQGQHGAAVSAAAHCAIRGWAHGALVSSVASDAAVTVADAKAACASAEARGSITHGRSAQAHDSAHGKSDDEHGRSGSAHGPKAHPSKQ